MYNLAVETVICKCATTSRCWKLTQRRLPKHLYYINTSIVVGPRAENGYYLKIMSVEFQETYGLYSDLYKLL